MSTRKSTKLTREDILDSGWALASREGANVSMLDIARAAGVSRQSVYLHFGSRAGLLMALVQRADVRFGIRADLLQALEIQAPAQRLDSYLTIWFRFVVKIVPVAEDLIRLRVSDCDAAAAWDNRMNDLRGGHRLLVESLKADGTLCESWSVSDATDYLWAAASIQGWALLVHERKWSHAKASRTLRRAIACSLLRRDFDQGPAI